MLDDVFLLDLNGTGKPNFEQLRKLKSTMRPEGPEDILGSGDNILQFTIKETRFNPVLGRQIHI